MRNKKKTNQRACHEVMPPTFVNKVYTYLMYVIFVPQLQLRTHSLIRINALYHTHDKKKQQQCAFILYRYCGYGNGNASNDGDGGTCHIL